MYREDAGVGEEVFEQDIEVVHTGAGGGKHHDLLTRPLLQECHQGGQLQSGQSEDNIID